MPREKAACVGFPVYDDLSAAARVSTDYLTLEAAGALGNAMHVGSVGLVMISVMFAAEWANGRP